VNNRETIKEIIKIFDSYPLLTSKKICQLEFLKKYLLADNSIDNYLLNRNFKYINQSTIINSNLLTNSVILPNYFKG
jgi:hypothetical protein